MLFMCMAEKIMLMMKIVDKRGLLSVISDKNILLYHLISFLYYTGFWGSVEIKNTFDVPLRFKWTPKSKREEKHFFALQSSGISF